MSAYDGGGTGDQILVHADSPIQIDGRPAGQDDRRRQGQLRTRQYPRPTRQGWADAIRCEAGVPPTRRRAVGVHPTPGRRVGDLGSVHRASRGSSCRCAASRRPRASPTATGSASRRIRRWRTRSATPRYRTCWCASKRRRAGRRTTPNSGRTATPPRWASIRRSQRSRRDEACGCRPNWTTISSHPSRSWPTCSRPRARSLLPHRSSTTGWTVATTTRFEPLFISTN